MYHFVYNEREVTPMKGVYLINKHIAYYVQTVNIAAHTQRQPQQCKTYLTHSSSPANTVNSPLNGFLRKKRSKVLSSSCLSACQ